MQSRTCQNFCHGRLGKMENVTFRTVHGIFNAVDSKGGRMLKFVQVCTLGNIEYINQYCIWYTSHLSLHFKRTYADSRCSMSHAFWCRTFLRNIRLQLAQKPLVIPSPFITIVQSLVDFSTSAKKYQECREIDFYRYSRNWNACNCNCREIQLSSPLSYFREFLNNNPYLNGI